MLVYFQGASIPKQLDSRILSLKSGKITYHLEKEITEEFFEPLNPKMIFLIASISRGNLSELNFKENTSKILELRQRIYNTKVFEVSDLSQEVDCEKINKLFKSETVALFDRDQYQIYFSKDISSRTKAEILSKYLFNNTSIISEVELILFFKEIEDLKKEFYTDDFESFRSSWDPYYYQKFEAFQKDILCKFGVVDITDSRWFIYSDSHRSEFLIDIFNSGKLQSLEDAIQSVKNSYQDEFNDFEIYLDWELDYKRIAEAICILKSIPEDKYDFSSSELINELNDISVKIGQEARLNEIEHILQKILISEGNRVTTEQKNNTELGLKVDRIFNQFLIQKSLKESSFEAEGSPNPEQSQMKKIKLIFQGKSVESECHESLETIGSNGEEQVLKYFIDEFLKLSELKRAGGINKVYEVIKEKLKNDSLNRYREDCLRVVSLDDELRKALIPLFYITMHHKYSFFDLIVYKTDIPTLIEVKSTKSTSNNSFIISISEVEAALQEPNYEIIRVTPEEMIFMGNPIKNLNEALDRITGENYSIKSQSFKFGFKR